LTKSKIIYILDLLVSASLIRKMWSEEIICK